MIGDTTKCRIAQFGCTMLEQLGAHEHQGNWETWVPQDADLMTLIQAHAAALDRALFTRDIASIEKHSAAIANYSMKAWETYAL